MGLPSFVLDPAKEAFCASLQALSYVSPGLRYHKDLQWLLILTMPNSGSTAFGKVLMTSKASVSLTPRCEGAWLIPSMYDVRSRWDESHSVSMARVRARWMWRLKTALNESPRVVIEKSPPNMVRIAQLRAALSPMTTHTVVLVRDPYAVCEGWHRRYGRRQLAQAVRPEALSESDYFRLLGENWIRRAGYLAKEIHQAVCVVRYEEFSADPAPVIATLTREVPLLEDAQPMAHIDVKDYGAQPVKNMNEEQIAALSGEQIAAITEGLQTGPELMAKFGYDFR